MLIGYRINTSHKYFVPVQTTASEVNFVSYAICLYVRQLIRSNKGQAGRQDIKDILVRAG